MIHIKSPKEIEIMAEGGSKLASIKKELALNVKVGVNAKQIEEIAMRLIKEAGAKASFTTVRDYKWATCINVNEVVVHGIPHESIVFKEGDLVSIDVGILYKGFHTDTSVSVGLNLSPDNDKFLKVGKKGLEDAIKAARPGNFIYDVSLAMQSAVESAGYSTIKALVGHGIGRDLHEEPQVPCFTVGRREESIKITPGMVLAIEIMYAAGADRVEVLEDGWTIAMRDAKIAGLFEETVAITETGNKVLTR